MRQYEGKFASRLTSKGAKAQSRNVLPRSSVTRGLNGLDERLDAQTSAEVEWLRPASSDSVKVSRDFNRLQIVEAKLVSWRNAEQAVWPVVRACLDPPESLTATL